jgi:hypothetical protein
MKDYKIYSVHDVYLDSYENGELEQVNHYTMKSEIHATNPKEAIKEYFKTILCYDFNINDAMISENDKNILYYSNLVDNGNVQASKNEIEQWRKNQIKLYSNNTTLFIYELKEVEI